MRVIAAASLFVMMASACFAQAPITDIPLALEPPPPEPGRIYAPEWIERPRADDFARHYPQAALSAGVDGRVMLDCTVRADGRVDCRVDHEEPPGRGFGAASLAVAQRFRMAPRLPDGTVTEAGRVRIPSKMAGDRSQELRHRS